MNFPIIVLSVHNNDEMRVEGNAPTHGPSRYNHLNGCRLEKCCHNMTVRRGRSFMQIRNPLAQGLTECLHKL